MQYDFLPSFGTGLGAKWKQLYAAAVLELYKGCQALAEKWDTFFLCSASWLKDKTSRCSAPTPARALPMDCGHLIMRA